MSRAGLQFHSLIGWTLLRPNSLIDAPIKCGLLLVCIRATCRICADIANNLDKTGLSNEDNAQSLGLEQNHPCGTIWMCLPRPPCSRD